MLEINNILDFSLMNTPVLCFFLILGILVLVLGGHLLTNGSINFSNYFGVSQLLIGLTIVSVATSLPELFTCLNAVAESADIALGSIIGSNIANIGLILGVTAIIFPLKSDISIIKKELPFLVAITAFFYFLGYTNNGFTFFEGITLLLIVSIFIIWQIKNSSTSDYTSTNEYNNLASKKPNIYVALIMIISGAFFLFIGADYLVESAKELALKIGISHSFVGLSVVALGTSLPELTAAIYASMIRANTLCLGNIIGSNIFNLTLIAGATIVYKPFLVNANFIQIELPLLILATLILWLFLRKENTWVGRIKGLMLLSFYLVVIVFTGLS